VALVTSKPGSIRRRDGAITEDGFIPEWVLHPEKFTYYLVGNPSTRFAITKSQEWRWTLPWRKPNGGWWLGRIVVWWSL
jgi:hypothetical protein